MKVEAGLGKEDLGVRGAGFKVGEDAEEVVVGAGVLALGQLDLAVGDHEVDVHFE